MTGLVNSQMSGLDKMWASFVGIGLMAAASLLITYARAKTKGILKFSLASFSFILLLIAMVYMLVSMS
jgi:hypothetical protein